MNINSSKIFVGSAHSEVTDEAKGISFPVLLHYPTNEVSSPTAFGPHRMDVCLDAKMMGGKFPLIIISHGSGGSHLLYRTISLYLAKHGYVVAMLEHCGNNRNNNALENTIENLQNHPSHVSLTIDKILSDTRFSEKILYEKIAVIGHSMGGYTALALAGGIPYTREGQKVEVVSDARIKAIVLMAPGAGWFKNNLAKVKIPILLYSAEHDAVTPLWNADIILNGITDKSQITFRKIINAGHFSFLSPFPATMKNLNFLPSTDPEGFDREAFHKILPEEILSFLNDKIFI